MAFSKIILNGTTLIDLTQDTVAANNLISPNTAHNAAGVQVTGTASDDFIITVSYNSTTEKYEPNKTFAEVQAAYSNGKNIVVTSNECLCVGSYENEYSTLYIEVYSDGYDIGYGLDSQGYQELYRAPLVNTQNANATASDVLDGMLAFGANGAIWGTIPRRTSSDIGVSDRTVTVTNGYYASNISVNVATGTAGTPSATKGTVSNHQVSITPSVTNTTGYITGGTKTGTAVTVSASELVSGNKEIISNGTNIDVTDYETVTVNVPDTFVINLSYNSTSGLYEPNKTFAEISAAYTAGKTLHLTGFDEDDEWLDTVCGYSTSSSLFWYEVVWHNYDNNLIYWDYCILRASGLTLEYRTTLDTPPTLQTKNNITPTTSSQTITPDSGYDGLSSVQINAMPSGTAGTPTATKGTVSNHSVSVTPSVTNTTGYISGGTKTGTAVTVSASELVSGNKEITSNGTNIDVADYSTVSVNVPSSGGMNFQTVVGGNRVNTTSYTAVSGQSITVAVSGKYTVSWTGFRSSTGGTNGSQLYIDDTAQGNVNTTFSNHIQINELTNITLNKNQVVTVRARARGTSYYMYVSNLTIRQTA